MRVLITKPGVITEEGEVKVGTTLNLQKPDGEKVIKVGKGKKVDKAAEGGEPDDE